METTPSHATIAPAMATIGRGGAMSGINSLRSVWNEAITTSLTNHDLIEDAEW